MAYTVRRQSSRIASGSTTARSAPRRDRDLGCSLPLLQHEVGLRPGSHRTSPGRWRSERTPTSPWWTCVRCTSSRSCTGPTATCPRTWCSPRTAATCRRVGERHAVGLRRGGDDRRCPGGRPTRRRRRVVRAAATSGRPHSEPAKRVGERGLTPTVTMKVADLSVRRPCSDGKRSAGTPTIPHRRC